MPIPDYQSLMAPILRECGDGNVHHNRDLTEVFAAEFSLTDDEREEMLPSGRVTVLKSRVGWARTYLKKAGLISYPAQACCQITDRGLEFLKTNPENVDRNMLKQFPGFTEFVTQKKPSQVSQEAVAQSSPETATPEELMERGYHDLRASLASELLDAIMDNSPEFFERLVVELLVAMGYGGSIEDAGQTVGKSGDGGIDGIIQEDRLGLDSIYIQAKRWDSYTVGRPEIQKFVGALQGQRARKGVFLTTAKFSNEAREYAKGIETTVVLIDGDQLTQLMIDFNLGVSPFASYKIKRLDSDYFLDD